MTEWTRVSLSARCAFCGHVFSDGEPALLRTFPTGGVYVNNARYYYCVDCKGPAPLDLPPLVRNRTTKRMTPIEGAGHAIRSELARRIGR